jgi:hypothetical protein
MMAKLHHYLLKLSEHEKRVTLTLFIVSFFLHLAVVIAIRHYEQPRLWENGSIATNLFEGKGFSADFSYSVEPTSWQAPGYPVLLVAFWKTIGQVPLTYFIISTLQCLALAAMIWPMGWLSRRWFPSVPPVLVQAIVVLAPLYLWYGTRIHHSAFVMAAHPWLVYGWLKCSHESFGKAIGIGALTGLVALFQPTILGLYGMCGIVLICQFVWQRDWRSFAILATAGTTVVLCLVPWTVRNYQIHGKLILIKSSFGKEFWMGNNPHATGTGYAIGGEEEITNKYPPKSFIELRGKVPEIELMAALQKEAMDFVKAHPDQFLKLTGEKILWFWTVAPKDRVRTTGAAEAIVFRGLYMVCWATLAALGIWGLIVARPKREYLLLTIYICLFFSLIYGLTHVGQARFRGELEFIFMPAAAAALWWLLNRFQANKPKA